MTESEAKKMKAEAEKLTLGKWYVGCLNGKSEEVMLMKDVMKIIDKHTDEDIKPCTSRYAEIYRKGWNEGRRKLLEAMEKEIAF